MTARKNRSVARFSPKSALDDFPTPPWATRALFYYVFPQVFVLNREPVLCEPACGRGHMARTLKEFSNRVYASDIKDYKKGYPIVDFSNDPVPPYDLLITNPPYKLANQFVQRGLIEANIGVALLLRTLWMEGGKDVPTSRWNTVLKKHPPNVVALISARMPATKGRVIQHHPVFFSHSWFVWNKMNPARHGDTRLVWIPPEAQRLFEKPEDYRH